MATGAQLEKSAGAKPAQPQLAVRLSALWGLARVRWAGMQSQQRRWSVATALLLAAMLGGLAWYGLRTDWRTLYSGLDPEDARQLGTTLTQAQIPFDVTDGGTGIRVAAAPPRAAALVSRFSRPVRNG